ncbi:hypothetical protein YC2023_055469 [Brassica napus]
MIGVRVCRWGRLCRWSGFFFLAEAPSEDLTGFDLESDGAWSPEEATIPAVLHCLPSSLLLCGYVWGGFSLGVVARAYELPMAARDEFLRLHLRLIGELRLPESSSGLWQRAGLSLSRNKGVIFGSVVSAKEVQSGGCGLGLVWYSGVHGPRVRRVGLLLVLPGLSEAVGLSTVLQGLGRLSLRELAMLCLA